MSDPKPETPEERDARLLREQADARLHRQRVALLPRTSEHGHGVHLTQNPDGTYSPTPVREVKP